MNGIQKFNRKQWIKKTSLKVQISNRMMVIGMN